MPTQPAFAVALVPALLCTAAIAFAQQHSTDGGVTYSNPNAIPTADLSVASSTITVTGAPFVIRDVSLITFLSHERSEDLDVTLVSPAGTVVTITTDNGGATSDVFRGTVWDDDATVPVTDSGFQSGFDAKELVPEGAMAAFRGENPNGIWRLDVGDDTAGAAGAFSWALRIAAVDDEPAFLSHRLDFATSVSLPDLTSTTRTIQFSGPNPQIFGIELFLDIDHSHPADLDIALTSPGGTRVTVTSDNGDSAADVFAGTLFSDDAVTLVSDATYTANVLQPLLVPEAAFGAFVGENPNGTWTLEIYDDAAGNQGVLNAWHIRLRATETNVVPGRSTGAPFQKVSFSIDRTPGLEGGNAFTGPDSLVLSGTLCTAGIVEDLSEAWLSIGVNGTPLIQTLGLDAEGRFATEPAATPNVRGALRPTTGRFQVSLSSIRLAELLSLANQNEEGEVELDLELSITGAGLFLSRARGTLVCAYRTVENDSTIGSYAFKSGLTRNTIFLATKAAAKQQSSSEALGTSSQISARGTISGRGDQPLVPTDTVYLAIGESAIIGMHPNDLEIRGAGSKIVLRSRPGSVQELASFSLDTSKRSFAFRTNALPALSLPDPGFRAPLTHALRLQLFVPTSNGLQIFDTVIELHRRTETSTTWSL
ncbi:MAG: proprotein convertase P-domain-containing protein [Planctomycetes bacterium]|nr:proprotein convertase P-domain-containing protein [Planctomycetota bacterium]